MKKNYCLFFALLCLNIYFTCVHSFDFADTIGATHIYNAISGNDDSDDESPDGTEGGGYRNNSSKNSSSGDSSSANTWSLGQHTYTFDTSFNNYSPNQGSKGIRYGDLISIKPANTVEENGKKRTFDANNCYGRWWRYSEKMSILVGSLNINDNRAISPSSWFIFRNAKNPSNKDFVKIGDNIEICSFYVSDPKETNKFHFIPARSIIGQSRFPGYSQLDVIPLSTHPTTNYKFKLMGSKPIKSILNENDEFILMDASQIFNHVWTYNSATTFPEYCELLLGKERGQIDKRNDTQDKFKASLIESEQNSMEASTKKCYKLFTGIKNKIKNGSKNNIEYGQLITIMPSRHIYSGNNSLIPSEDNGYGAWIHTKTAFQNINLGVYPDQGYREKMSPTWFVLENAEYPQKKGPILFGDKIRITSFSRISFGSPITIELFIENKHLICVNNENDIKRIDTIPYQGNNLGTNSEFTVEGIDKNMIGKPIKENGELKLVNILGKVWSATANRTFSHRPVVGGGNPTQNIYCFFIFNIVKEENLNVNNKVHYESIKGALPRLEEIHISNNTSISSSYQEDNLQQTFEKLQQQLNEKDKIIQQLKTSNGSQTMTLQQQLRQKKQIVENLRKQLSEQQSKEYEQQYKQLEDQLNGPVQNPSYNDNQQLLLPLKPFQRYNPQQHQMYPQMGSQNALPQGQNYQKMMAQQRPNMHGIGNQMLNNRNINKKIKMLVKKIKRLNKKLSKVKKKKKRREIKRKIKQQKQKLKRLIKNQIKILKQQKRFAQNNKQKRKIKKKIKKLKNIFKKLKQKKKRKKNKGNKNKNSKK
jgi:hypothetical protein